MPVRKGSSYKPGDIRIVSGLSVPFGFVPADHSAVPQAKYPALFREIGHLWRQPGDNDFNTLTHFRLPDGTKYMRAGQVFPRMVFDGDASVTGGGVYAVTPAITNQARTISGTFPNGVSQHFVSARSAVTRKVGRWYWVYRIGISGSPSPGHENAYIALGLADYAVEVNTFINVENSHGNMNGVFQGPYGDSVGTGYNGANPSIGGTLRVADGDTVAFFVDMDTGAWGYRDAQGVEHVNCNLLTTTTGATLDYIGIDGYLFSTLRADYTGGTYSLQLLTDAEASAAGKNSYLKAGYKNAAETQTSIGVIQGSNTTAGTALLPAQIPAHTHQYNYAPTNLAGDHGTGIAGGNGTAFIGRATDDAAGQLQGQAHDHAFNAPESIFQVLVKV